MKVLVKKTILYNCKKYPLAEKPLLIWLKPYIEMQVLLPIIGWFSILKAMIID
jgi:hypothetical protein